MSDYYDLEDVDKLKAELAVFQREKERVRKLIGGIGGEKYSKRDNIINAVFLFVVIVLFVMEAVFHVLPTFLTL